MELNHPDPIYIDGMRHLYNPLITFYIIPSKAIESHTYAKFINNLITHEYQEYFLPHTAKRLAFGYRRNELLPVCLLFNDITIYINELTNLGCFIFMYVITERFKLDSQDFNDYRIITSVIV